jgi:hypothetical protein
MNPGAFVVLRVGFVLRGDVSAIPNYPILWTGFRAKITHQSQVFSYWAGILFFLWTSAFKSKGGLSTKLGGFVSVCAADSRSRACDNLLMMPVFGMPTLSLSRLHMVNLRGGIVL